MAWGASERSASQANFLILLGKGVRPQRGSGADHWVRIESENGGRKPLAGEYQRERKSWITGGIPTQNERTRLRCLGRLLNAPEGAGAVGRDQQLHQDSRMIVGMTNPFAAGSRPSGYPMARSRFGSIRKSARAIVSGLTKTVLPA